MTKSEVYKSLIEIHKKGGQGLSGIVRVRSREFDIYLDELIEEGLVQCYDGGGSLGHPESNRWYMPTKGYNVWTDGIKNGEGDTDFLTCVRLYLGSLEDQEEGEREPIQKWLNPSAQLLMQNPYFMEKYSKWLTRNSEQLEIMKSLDEFYTGSNTQFTDEESEEIKSKIWYEENKTIKECLKDSEERVSNRKEFIRLNKELLKVYSKLGDSQTDIDKAKSDIKEAEKELAFRKKLHKWFNEQDMNTNIQDVFGKEKETV